MASWPANGTGNGAANGAAPGGRTTFVSSEELLAGAQLTFDFEIPSHLLEPHPWTSDTDGEAGRRPAGTRRIRLRPLTLSDVQLIARAARNDEVLTSALMIQRSAVEPALRAEQVAEMHGGLVRYLVERINQISGLTTADDDLRDIADSPLVQAFFILAREFGWTPQQVRELTVGQVIGYLELLNRPGGGREAPAR